VGSGEINTDALPEGEHGFRIVCKDYQENTTELSGNLIANHRPEFRIDRVDNEEITLAGENLTPIEKVTVFGKKNAAIGWIQHTLTSARFEHDKNGIGLPVNTSQYDVVKVVAESKYGSQSDPQFWFLRKPAGSNREMRVAAEINADYVRCTITTAGVFTAPPVAYVDDEKPPRFIRLAAVEPFRYAGSFIPGTGGDQHHTLRINAEVNGEPATADYAFDALTVRPAGSGRIAAADGRLTLSYDSAAVYKTLLLQAGVDTEHSVPVYTLEPVDVVLNRGFRVSVAAAGAGDADHLGLYFRSNGEWIFQTSTPDSAAGTYSTRLTRTLGELALLHDAEPPSFSRLRASVAGRKAVVAFRYHDNLSGVDTDEIRMTIDDALVIPEVDGEHHQVWYKGTEPLSPGRHALRITMKDRMKNVAEIQRTLSVR
jgi:hypothetical protein